MDSLYIWSFCWSTCSLLFFVKKINIFVDEPSDDDDISDRGHSDSDNEVFRNIDIVTPL